MGHLFSSPIFIHFLITALLVLGIFVVYVIHKRLTGENGFRITILLRWMLLPSIISVAMIFLFLSFNQNPPHVQNASPVSASETAEAAASAPLPDSGTGSVLANTLVKIAQVFSMEITVDEVWELYAGTGDQAAIPASPSKTAVFWISFVMASAPLLTIFTAASFFRLPRFWAAMLLPIPGKRFFVFSELNEHSRKYAFCLNNQHETTLHGKRTTVRPYIIFCCDDTTADESVELGHVLLMKRSITNLHICGKKRFNFYLISNNESLNVEQASILKKKYQHKCAQIFCVSNGLVSEHAVDNLNKTLLTSPGKESLCHGIGLIDEKLRVVYQDLYENPLLTREFLQKVDATEKDPSLRQIRILVLGAGRVGELVTRTMMWYCQLPGYNVHITVADIEEKKVLERRIFRNSPSADNVKALDIFKDRVQIDILEKQNLLTSDLEHILSGRKDTLPASPPASLPASPPVFHAVYVCLGEDNRNYQTSLKVRQFYLRSFLAWGCPQIRIVIWDDTISELVENSIQLKGSPRLPGTKKYTNYCLQSGKTSVRDDPDNRMCPVHLLGSTKKTLLSFEDLQMDAFRYHTYYCNPKLNKEETPQLCEAWDPLFDKEHPGYQQCSQSDVRSNYAVALHGYVKHQWKAHLQEQGQPTEGDAFEESLAESEHIRWSIFKLTEGSWPVPKELTGYYLYNNSNGQDNDTLRGYHVCLTGWEQFNQWEKSYPGNASFPEQFIPGMDSHFSLLLADPEIQADQMLCRMIEKYKALLDSLKHQPASAFDLFKKAWDAETKEMRDDSNTPDSIAQFIASVDQKIRVFGKSSHTYGDYFKAYWKKQKETDKNLALFSIMLEDSKQEKGA